MAGRGRRVSAVCLTVGLLALLLHDKNVLAQLAERSTTSRGVGETTVGKPATRSRGESTTVTSTGGGTSELQGWNLNPRLIIGETYSDNVFLDPPGEEESDFVTQINPGISVNRQGGRLGFNLDYLMQNLFYARNSSANDTNHLLQSNGTAELLRDRFFVDGNASIRQVFISPEGRTRISADQLDPFGGLGRGFSVGASLGNNISGNENRTTAFNYGISPYWTSEFFGYAELLARYRYQKAQFSGGGGDDTQDEGEDGNQINTIEVNLNSGRRFVFTEWQLNYFYSKLDAENDNDSRDERVEGQFSYALNRMWNLIARGGYDNSESTTLRADTGAFWALGAEWIPNRFFQLNGLYGLNDNEIRLRFSPTVRTLLEVSRRDLQVGIDPGVRWEGLLQHNTVHSNWSARYIDAPSSNVDVLSEVPVFATQEQDVIPGGTETLTEGEFRRKRFDANVDYTGIRGRIAVNAYAENRDRREEDEETIFGGGIGLSYRIFPKTRAVWGGAYERDEPDSDTQDNLWTTGIGLIIDHRTDLQSAIGYQYSRSNSNQSDREYRENRIGLRIDMTF